MPFGPVDLVRAQRYQVDPERARRERNLSHGLRRIRVEQHAVLAGQADKLGDRLHDTGLVVGDHDTEEHGLLNERRRDVIHRDPSVRPR
jgi:hypothetical protein